MASSLFILIDDIAAVLDDVALMTKVAAKNTAGVLGDDLALNAQQVSGVNADRELPVVWAVAKGSMRNKLILVPSALAISALLPWAIIPLLMIGGAYLCFEGFEKIAHRWLHPADAAAHEAEHIKAVANPVIDLVTLEREKVQAAIRTDFILSAEITVIALGTVAAASLGERIAVLSAIAVVMTVGVYGLVAGIVKLDDAGLHLARRQNASLRALGKALLAFAPWLMKTLSVVGTAAMFMVGGSILSHGIPPLHHAVVQAGAAVASVPGAGTLLSIGIDALVGLAAGALAVLLLAGGQRWWSQVKTKYSS